MAAHYSLAGRRFNMLHVLFLAGRTPNGRQHKWRCRCDCGVEKDIAGGSLTSGRTVSCGCFGRGKSKTHGLSRDPLHRIWAGMIQRCYYSKSISYEFYGARGVSVCQRWRNFDSFREDMGERPGPQYSIERNNNNGNYEPSNCRWATVGEQNRHKRLHKNNTSGVTGVGWHERDGKWGARIRVARKLIDLGSFESKGDAIAARKAAERRLGFHPDHGAP